MKMSTQGDLNNASAARAAVSIAGDDSYIDRDLAIPSTEDDVAIRKEYRSFLLDPPISKSDWIAKLELNTVLQMVEEAILARGGERLKVLVLYGSLRERSFESGVSAK